MRERESAASAALLFGSLWGLAEATAGHALHSLRVPGLAGLLMFPLGFFLMSSAYGRSKNLLSVLMTSWVAASVKLVDVLIPGADMMAVVNPAQAIILQGLAAAGLLSVLGKETPGSLAALFLQQRASGSSNRTPHAGSRAVTSEREAGEESRTDLPETGPGETRMGTPKFPSTLVAAAAAASLAWRAAHLALGLFWASLLRAPNILQSGSLPVYRFLSIDALAEGAFIIIFILRARFLFAPDHSAAPGSPRYLVHPAASLACLAAAVLAEVAL